MQLPLLERRKPELETCAFCPKLSRAVCPVSNADGRETTTPWGKMSASYLLARGAVEATPEQAWPPWACTGCFHCRQACELKNDVAGTLLDARADLTKAGLAPPTSMRVLERHEERSAELVQKIDAAIARARARGVRVEAGATKLVIGCLSPRFDGPDAHGDDPAADAIVAAARLNGGAIEVVRGCCGGPLRLAGDRDGFTAAARAFGTLLAGARTVVVADAGCAHMIARRYEEVGASLPPTIEIVHLVELAARSLPRLRSVSIEGSVRYHDACHLGRGLGVFEPPRAVLSAILGRAPEEFARRREESSCAGGGGLVPVTMPKNARGIADMRLDQHRSLGGGAIATTCAASRKMLSRDGTRVYDLATLIARALD
jgi:Fe-S oxidoreductase